MNSLPPFSVPPAPFGRETLATGFCPSPAIREHIARHRDDMDAEISTLFRQRDEIDRRISVVEGLRSTDEALLAPVRRLPQDLLSQIFEQIARDLWNLSREKDRLENVTLVCKLWRDVALSTPTMWGYITFPFPPTELRLNEDDHLSLLLSRSKMAHLRVDWGYIRAILLPGHRTRDNSAILFPQLLTAAHRLIRLELHDALLDKWAEQHGEMFVIDTPALRALGLISTASESTSGSFCRLARFRAPCLQELSLSSPRLWSRKNFVDTPATLRLLAIGAPTPAVEEYISKDSYPHILRFIASFSPFNLTIRCIRFKPSDRATDSRSWKDFSPPIGTLSVFDVHPEIERLIFENSATTSKEIILVRNRTTSSPYSGAYLRTYVHNWASVTSLCISPFSIQLSNVEGCRDAFQSLSSVETLSFVPIAFGADTLFALLTHSTRRDSDSLALFPNMRSFTFAFDYFEDEGSDVRHWKSLIQMISSRVIPSSTTPLASRPNVPSNNVRLEFFTLVHCEYEPPVAGSVAASYYAKLDALFCRRTGVTWSLSSGYTMIKYNRCDRWSGPVGGG